ncbi:SurA N-terminal domain-containing protein [Sphingomonas sp.]|jgi:peptidyl-prolyl cis-trans isomerase D|uniref:SurA N-terminal domain-containing protein n=1 Tax=Sphingomonas sp. TaxID=28214 RepID=UPI00262CDCBF|nr:SurA N-terminal domain-containing protein [Sphingomonas sp.]MDF2602668.1 peptidylprolyl isomerase [Sphingomonas sp.]
MLGFFRRIINSRVGVIVTMGVLGLIAIAFALGDITGLQTGGASGATVAKVGGESVNETELTRRVQDELRGAQQRNPGLEMSQLVAEGGVEAILDRMLNGLALQAFGRDQGMVVSKALVGSELRNIPGLQGPTGKFDQAVYEQVLARNRLTDAQVQEDIARETMVQFLLRPQMGATQVPESLALPYASLLLERRAGQVALIPAAAMPGGAAPTDAELQDWYKRNIARYSLPERRIVRYAMVTPEFVKARGTPSDAEIAAAYNGDKARWAARETRTVSLVTVLDQNAANALATKIRGGTPVADAARAAGLEARRLEAQDKQALTGATSGAVADAAFAAPANGVIGPVRGSIGFVVGKIEKVAQVPGKTLAEARPTLVEELTKKKTADALTAMRDSLENAIADNANFSELVAEQKLSAATTPALTATGANPEAPTAQPDPALMPILSAAFQSEEGDDPQVVQIGPDGSFALVALDRIVRAAPRPITQVRDQVTKDLQEDRARRAARTAASKALAAINKGVAFDKALAEAGAKGAKTDSVVAARSQINADPRGPNPVLALLFSMKGGTAKMLEAPDRSGWLIVKVDKISPGDAAKAPQVIAATRQDLGRAMGPEYAQQFTEAVKRAMKVSQNADALARVKASLSGEGGSNP